ncbi:hypothetical protein SCHPADRAFT_919983 [Schizopora paradoxa]|uniref:WW domain-containing protein n=1 Tax=Schizopora paradoxa TaxID=27342 RepID=A0A0H2SGR1_9AGAM|nr:hypothetical protein SCHPADRAFT_919983 [Schizopora paradoxa]
MSGHIPLFHRDDRRAGSGLDEPAPPQRPVVGIRQFPLLNTQYIGAIGLQSEDSHKPVEDEKGDAGGREGRRCIPLPDGWKYYIHPKGWVYYYNSSQRLVTDYRMEYRPGQQEFDHALRETEAIGYPPHQLPPSCEIWIDFKLQDGRSVPEKMFVDHSKRRLTPNAPPHRRRYSAVAEPPRSPDVEEGTWADDEIDVWQQLLYEQAYWGYIMDHPCHAPLSKDAEEDAFAALAWYSQDRLMHAEDSIVPYSTQLSKDLLDLLSMMSERGFFNGARSGYIKTRLVACILERVAGERLRSHYGQEDARTHLKRSFKRRHKDFEEPHKFGLNHILHFVMTVLCLGAPYAYLRHINEFFMPGIGRTDTITERWTMFVENNVADWTNTNLVSTVLVSASVAMLAVPGIDKATRILGLGATLCAIASVIIGLLNVWQHMHRSRTEIELRLIFDFFEESTTYIKTDKFLAILLSLPMVLLLWATLLFAASMVTFAWLGVDTTFRNENFGNAVTNNGTSNGGGGGGGGGGNSGGFLNFIPFRFGETTAWVTLAAFCVLTVVVTHSVLYFYKAWSSRKYKEHKETFWDDFQNYRQRRAFRSH